MKVFFGADKTETVATLAPVKEPKMSKEEIMYLNKNVYLLQTYDSTLRLFVWSTITPEKFKFHFIKKHST